MTKPLDVNTKSRGRPKTTGTGELVGVRLQPDQLTALDAWIDRQPEPKPSRPDAMRKLLQKGLESSARKKGLTAPDPEATKARRVASRARAEAVVDKALASIDAPQEEKDRRRQKLTRISTNLKKPR